MEENERKNLPVASCSSETTEEKMTRKTIKSEPVEELFQDHIPATTKSLDLDHEFIKCEPHSFSEGESDDHEFNMTFDSKSSSYPSEKQSNKVTVDPLGSTVVGQSSNGQVSKQKTKKKRVEEDEFEKEVLELLRANTSITYRDPDEMFFLSQLPAIKRLAASDKLDFQVKFIKLLRTYIVKSSSSSSNISRLGNAKISKSPLQVPSNDSINMSSDEDLAL